MKEYIKDIERHLSCSVTLGEILLSLVDDGAVGRHVSGLLQDIVDGDPKHLRETNVNEMALHISPDFLLYLRRIGSNVDYISELSGTDSYLRTCPRQSLSVIAGNVPVTDERFCVTPDGAAIRSVGKKRHQGGLIVENKGSDTIIDLMPIEGTAWTVRLNYGPMDHEIRFFDRETLKWVFTASAYGELSSLASLCQAFGVSKDKSSLAYLLELAEHEAHFVRWAAIQNIGRVDGDAARTLLREALDDPHPDIRSAAVRTLERIGAVHV